MTGAEAIEILVETALTYAVELGLDESDPILEAIAIVVQDEL